MKHFSTTGGSRAKTPIRCIGTYHKTGTVWMARVFKNIAKALDLPFIRIGREEHASVPEPGTTPIYFQTHSQFSASMLNWDVSGLRLVRDPRDVIISGAHYHCKSTEAWLHRPLERLGDRTYAETINRFDSNKEKYLFELENIGGLTARRMANSNGNEQLHCFIEQNFLTVKYEDLIDDRDLITFRTICAYLDLPFEESSKHFVARSLFGGAQANKVHVRSGKGEQWRQEFDRELAEAFAAEHQGTLEILGYEKDDSWVKEFK